MPCDDAYHITTIIVGAMLGYGCLGMEESGARYAIELMATLVADDGVKVVVRTEDETHVAAIFQTARRTVLV